MESDPTALEAATSGSTTRARVRHDGREFAEVAVPLFPGGDVMLLSSSLADQLATVALVKRRLLDATLAALLIVARPRLRGRRRSMPAGSAVCSAPPT